MPNNPVQFIANGDDFIQDRDPGRKGEEKDFFENRDADFKAHQDALVQAIEAIDDAITRAGHGPATYVRVTLREAALAKSYRPNAALLTADRFPCVGAGAIGEMFFFLPQVQIPELIARIRRAEPTVPVTTSKAGRVYRTTTRLRSEVGAIETIEILPAADKRLFSATVAVQAFLDPHTFPGYQVELFEVPPLKAIETDRWGRRQLFESLFHMLLSLGDGARSFLLPDVGRTPMLEVQLTRSTDTATLADLRQPVTLSAGVPATTADIDLSVDRHEAALNQLAAHPLVRRIDPPVQLTLEQKDKPIAAKSFLLPAPASGAAYPRIGVIDSGVSPALQAWTIGRSITSNPIRSTPRTARTSPASSWRDRPPMAPPLHPSPMAVRSMISRCFPNCPSIWSTAVASLTSSKRLSRAFAKQKTITVCASSICRSTLGILSSVTAIRRWRPASTPSPIGSMS